MGAEGAWPSGQLRGGSGSGAARVRKWMRRPSNRGKWLPLALRRGFFGAASPAPPFPRRAARQVPADRSAGRLPGFWKHPAPRGARPCRGSLAGAWRRWTLGAGELLAGEQKCVPHPAEDSGARELIWSHREGVLPLTRTAQPSPGGGPIPWCGPSVHVTCARVRRGPAGLEWAVCSDRVNSLLMVAQYFSSTDSLSCFLLIEMWALFSLP